MFDRLNELSQAIYVAQQAIEVAKRLAEEIQLGMADDEDEVVVENLAHVVDGLNDCEARAQEAAEHGDECTDVFCCAPRLA